MRKTADGDMTVNDPVPVEAPALMPKAEEQPSEGGSWIRMPDGTLQREQEG